MSDQVFTYDFMNICMFTTGTCWAQCQPALRYIDLHKVLRIYIHINTQVHVCLLQARVWAQRQPALRAVPIVHVLLLLVCVPEQHTSEMLVREYKYVREYIDVYA